MMQKSLFSTCSEGNTSFRRIYRFSSRPTIKEGQQLTVTCKAAPEIVV